MKSKYSFNQEYNLWVEDAYVTRIPYSDGTETETRLFEIVRNSGDLSVLSEELESHISDWASLCFLSKRRSNLLRPFSDLLKGKYILEVGCGAGPVTRFLGECGAQVYAVEPNLQRARIAAERCRDLPNIRIFCDDMEGFEADRSFDGIVQIGVLEYATKYSHEKNAPLNFLIRLKDFLAPDGFLLTAIENQLGLKYFSGFAEDHVGTVMYGINNNYRPAEVTTFGRKRLVDLLEQAGFPHNELFLPFPDYKLPSLIVYPGFNEKNKLCQFNMESILSNISYMDWQPNIPLFSLDKALPLIAQNDLLTDLSNSFCVFSHAGKANAFDENVLFALYNTERKKEYCKETIFKREKDSLKVIRNTLGKPLPEKDAVISFSQEEAVYMGTLYHYFLVKIVNRDDWQLQEVGTWLAGWFDFLKKELASIGNFKPDDFSNMYLKVDSRYIDAIPINLLVLEDGYRFIDLEIRLKEDAELGYLIFRSIYVSLTRLSNVAPPADPANIETKDLFLRLFAHLGYHLTEEELDRYYELEAQLSSSVTPVKLKTLKGTADRLKTRLRLKDIPSLSEDIKELQSRNRHLQEGLSNKENDIRELQFQLHQKQKQIETLNRHALDLNSAVENERDIAKTLEAEINDIGTVNETLCGHIRNLSDYNGKLNTGILDLNTRVGGLNVHTESLEDQIRELNIHKEKLEGHIRFLDDHVTNLLHEIHSLSTSRKRMITNFLKRSLSPLFKPEPTTTK